MVIAKRMCFRVSRPLPDRLLESLVLIRYHAGAGKRNTWACFTVLSKQDGKTLGGSTYVLRY
jgi:hypothetical protein